MRRRQFLQSVVAAPLLAAGGVVPARAGAGVQVVVVGGGFGGLAAAYALRALLPAARVLLVERRREYGMAAFSNFAVVGRWRASRLRFDYTAARAAGVEVIHAEVQRVEEGALHLSDGVRVPFDRAILAPGASFNHTQVEGAAHPAIATAMPHAYDGGAQVETLQQQLAALPADGVLMLIPPPSPYSCSPAPYDRAGLVAEMMTRAAPRGKVLILDQKEQFAQQTLFSDGWNAHYRERIEWLSAEGGGALERIDAAAGVVHTEFGEERADVINYIPPQRAAAVLHRSNLVDASGWCPVHPQTLESPRLRGVHIAGDATALSPAPKSGSCAMSQGKVAAAAVARALSDAAVAVPTELHSICFSHIAADTAFAEEGMYALTPSGVVAEKVTLTPRHTPAEELNKIAQQGTEWWEATVREIFGR